MSLAVDQFPTEPVVDYENFRSQIEHGDLLLCSGSGWFSRMIKAATQSVWSHVGFVMRLDDIGRIMVLESIEPLGVRTVPLRKYIEDYDNEGNPYPGGLVIARHADFAESGIQGRLGQFGRFAVDLFGYPYDKDEIAKIAARIAASYLPFMAGRTGMTQGRERRTGLQLGAAKKAEHRASCIVRAWGCTRQ